MKNVLIISSSPRKNGNSQMLCEAFKKGVEESGNFAKLIRLAEKNIGYCKACDFYGKPVTREEKQRKKGSLVIYRVVNRKSPKG